MSHHETKNTIAVAAWCNACQKRTMHSVSGKKRGLCQEHAPTGLSKKQEQAKKKREREEENKTLSLF